jgi:hypothetical protein
MTTEIFAQNHGRSISSYDLLDEVQEAYGLSQADAHNAIHAMLTGIVEASDGSVIIDRRPVRPELLESNPNDLDITYWLTVSDETATEIREALAALYAA